MLMLGISNINLVYANMLLVWDEYKKDQYILECIDPSAFMLDTAVSTCYL